MIKKIAFCLLFVIIFAACKKEIKPAASVTYDVTGNWTLYSWQSNAPALNVTASQYPCMADNVLTLNADGTTSLSYTGSDSCYVTPSGHLGSTIGIPGQASAASTWKLSGDKLYMPSNSSNPGVITSVNGKLYLTTIDSAVSGSTKYYTTTVDVKQ